MSILTKTVQKQFVSPSSENDLIESSYSSALSDDSISKKSNPLFSNNVISDQETTTVENKKITVAKNSQNNKPQTTQQQNGKSHYFTSKSTNLTNLTNIKTAAQISSQHSTPSSTPPNFPSKYTISGSPMKSSSPASSQSKQKSSPLVLKLKNSENSNYEPLSAKQKNVSPAKSPNTNSEKSKQLSILKMIKKTKNEVESEIDENLETFVRAELDDEDEIPYTKVVIPKNVTDFKGWVRLIEPYSSGGNGNSSMLKPNNRELEGSVYLETTMSNLTAKASNLGTFDVILIHPPWPMNPYDWNEKPKLSDIIPRQLSFLLSHWMPAGFLFIWIEKEYIQEAFKLIEGAWRCSYVENIEWVRMMPNNRLEKRKYDYLNKSKLTLFMFKKGTQKFELRHQRNPDVVKDFVRLSPNDPTLSEECPEEIYTIIETLFPRAHYSQKTGKGRFLEIFSSPKNKRKGWTTVHVTDRYPRVPPTELKQQQQQHEQSLSSPQSEQISEETPEISGDQMSKQNCQKPNPTVNNRTIIPTPTPVTLKRKRSFSTEFPTVGVVSNSLESEDPLIIKSSTDPEITADEFPKFNFRFPEIQKNANTNNISSEEDIIHPDVADFGDFENEQFESNTNDIDDADRDIPSQRARDDSAEQ